MDGQLMLRMCTQPLAATSSGMHSSHSITFNGSVLDLCSMASLVCKSFSSHIIPSYNSTAQPSSHSRHQRHS